LALHIIGSSKVNNVLTIKKRTTIAIISLIVGILVFAVAYISMSYRIIFYPLNQTILSWMVSQRETNLTNIAKIVTTIANPIIFASIVGIVVIIWAMIKREVWRPILLASAMATAALTSIILKSVIRDARPPQIDMVPLFETDFSFPSGHTLGMAVFLFVIGYLIYSRHFSTLRFWAWIIIALIGTLLIALSRLYLGYHWLTDVMASLGLGLIILAIVIFIDSIVINKSRA